MTSPFSEFPNMIPVNTLENPVLLPEYSCF